MVATFYLLTYVWAVGQPGDRPPAPVTAGREPGNWVLAPRLGRGQELVYRGTFSEEAASSGVQFSRYYRIESRVFVLEALSRGLDVAFLTTLRGKAAPGEPQEPSPASIRLEVAQVDLQGRVLPEGRRPLAVPLEGPPTAECGAFVEVPPRQVRPDESWVIAEEGRPVRTWRAVGYEMVDGTSCLKLVGTQESDDWERPRADRAAWRRQDTVWLAPRLGITYRVERVLERRDPARRDVSHRSTLRYELESPIQYPRHLYEDRRDEIVKARTFQEKAAPLLASPGRAATGQVEALLARVQYHLDHQPPTPYREAVLQIKQRLEAARRGESPPAPLNDEGSAAPAVAAVGTAAPDFLATDYTGHETARLQHWLGRPVVLVFYSPASTQAAPVLHFAQRLADAYHEQVAVLGLAMGGEAEQVRRQRDALGLTIPLLDGGGLRQSYDVSATPKLVVLDAAGVVRCGYVGWGQEVRGAVLVEVQRCLAPQKP
jgi:peroxiredoxin